MLTTRCPHCSTVFRVRPEQLSVRGGRVRCGHCQQAFSALSYLEEMEDDLALPPNPVPPVAPRPAGGAAPLAAEVPEGGFLSVPAPRAMPEAEPFELARVELPQAYSSDVGQELPPVVNPLAGEAAMVEIPLDDLDLSGLENPEPAFGSTAPLDGDFRAFSATDARQDVPPGVQVDAMRFEPAMLQHEDFRLDLDLGDDEPIGPEADPAPADQGPAAESVTQPELPDATDSEAAPEAGAVVVHAPQVPAAPYESKIARELGIAPYDPAEEPIFGQTVMLEEPIDLRREPEVGPDAGPASLFDELQEQHAATRKPLVEDRRKRRFDWRWTLGCVALAGVAAVQLVYVFRTEVARSYPALRPALEEACATLGCSVPYPREASDEKIKIESSEFFADSGGAGRYRLVATIANHVSYAQAWPSLELTVTDRFDMAIARRVLPPEAWLPENVRNEPAFPGHGEVTANLSLNLDQLAASGYRLYVFYP